MSEYTDELKDEGIKFFKYFTVASKIEKAAIATFLIVIFILGGILL